VRHAFRLTGISRQTLAEYFAGVDREFLADVPSARLAADEFGAEFAAEVLAWALLDAVA
jgi:hypothetical protein